MPCKCPRCGKQFKGNGVGTHVMRCPVTPEEIFWSRVDKTGDCWIYQGCRDKWGYAHYGIKAKRVQAHRYAYELTFGPIPAGKLIMHSCDNPPCVRPEHLRIGTNAENHRDCVSKLRHAYGEGNRHAKLTEDQVQAIRAAYWYEKGRSNIQELAAKYGVSHITVNALISGRTWRHLPHTPIKPRASRAS